jgi:hypothetical protein
MSSSPRDLLDKANECIDWYWKHGIKRVDPRYDVSRGSWLDAVYRLRDQAQAVLRSELRAKPTMAIWGPSQSGKSTLLSGYLDEPGDDLGERSALKWSETEPVRFVVGGDKSDRVIVLNPFNFGSDASGCVSRFTLCNDNDVKYPDHPVELELASEAQLMQALAVGYLSECEMKNAKGEVTSWDADSFKALLEKQVPSNVPQRATFEAVQQLANTLDLLILSELPRYQNLAPLWDKSLRPLLLQNTTMLGSVEKTETFAFELLWDNWASLTQAFRNLSQKRRSIIKQWGETTKIYCSYRAAAVLLDIDSYKKCESNSSIRKKVLALTVSKAENAIFIGNGTGAQLADNPEEFGYFQGLVWEMGISVRRDVLRSRAPVLSQFLEKADLLDFPGVANSYGNASRHTDASVAQFPIVALTEVLKRGKTASIVVTSARNLDIDGFSLLMRLGRFPAQPIQLVSGIRSWLKAYGQSWPPHARNMPLNMVMTFCSTLINQVISVGIRDGLQGCFDQLKSLGHLADPKVVNAFATNYSHFPEGQITGKLENQAAALSSILDDSAFHERFGDSKESFHEMVKNGGTDYFFQKLTEQASSSRRRELVLTRLQESAVQLQGLISQHMPSAGADSIRQLDLNGWRDAIRTRAKGEFARGGEECASTRLSRYLRHFLNIDPDELDDIPLKAIQTKLNVRGFIEKQYSTWRSNRASYPHLAELGISDSTQAGRILSYLVEAANLSGVELFFRDNLGYVNGRMEAKHLRRFLAAKMTNSMLQCPSTTRRGHRPVIGGSEAVKPLLEDYASLEELQNYDPEQSPHYRVVILPLLLRLEDVVKLGGGNRPPQIGDDELVNIWNMP